MRPEYDLVPVPPAPGLRRLHRRHDHRRRDHGRAVAPRAHRRGDRGRRLPPRRRACGRWARAIALSLQMGMPWTPPPVDQMGSNPHLAQLRHPGRPHPLVHLPPGRPLLARPVPLHRPARPGRPTSASPTTPRSSPTPNDAVAILTEIFAGAPLEHWRAAAGGLRGPVGRGPEHPRGRRRPADRRQRLRAGQRHRRRRDRAARHRAGAVRRRSRPRPAGRPSSTSTATTSSPSSASTGTPSSTSRSAASSPERRRSTIHHPPPRGYPHVTVRCVPLRRQARPGRRRGHRHGPAPPPSCCSTPAPRSSSWTTPPVDLAGATGIHVNLSEKDSIDAAIDECGGPVHAVFSCAGVDEGTPNIEKINFIGHRHLIERLIADGTLGRGAAIAMISSAAGLGWESNLERNLDYLATPDFDVGGGVGRGQRRGRLHVDQAGHLHLRGLQRPPAPEARASASTPSPPGPPTPRWPRPTPSSGSASAPTTAPTSASRRRAPLEQANALVFLCSDAAAAPSTGSPSSPTWATSRPASPGRGPTPRRRCNFLLGRF